MVARKQAVFVFQPLVITMYWWHSAPVKQLKRDFLLLLNRLQQSFDITFAACRFRGIHISRGYFFFQRDLPVRGALKFLGLNFPSMSYLLTTNENHILLFQLFQLLGHLQLPSIGASSTTFYWGIFNYLLLGHLQLRYDSNMNGPVNSTQECESPQSKAIRWMLCILLLFSLRESSKYAIGDSRFQY